MTNGKGHILVKSVIEFLMVLDCLSLIMVKELKGNGSKESDMENPSCIGKMEQYGNPNGKKENIMGNKSSTSMMGKEVSTSTRMGKNMD